MSDTQINKAASLFLITKKNQVPRQAKGKAAELWDKISDEKIFIPCVKLILSDIADTYHEAIKMVEEMEATYSSKGVDSTVYLESSADLMASKVADNPTEAAQIMIDFIAEDSH